MNGRCVRSGCERRERGSMRGRITGAITVVTGIRRWSARSGDDAPFKRVIYVSQQIGQKPSHAVGHERYARLPISILHDKDLSAFSRCIYAELAMAVWQGTVASIGQRLIANRLGFSKNTVTAGIRELEARGHITIKRSGKQRYFYHLESPVFGKKQRALDEGAVVAEELVSFPRCRLATARKTA